VQGTRTTDRSTLLLTSLLVIGLAAGAVLFIMLWRGPSSAGRFETAAPAAIDCPAGTGTPVCYGVDVTNTGEGAQQVRCEVAPGPDTAALFANGSGVYVSAAPVEAGNTIQLTVEVSPSQGSTIVSVPSVACGAFA
jgi:hypothetical protein